MELAEIKHFLNELEKEMRPLYKAYRHDEWDAQVNGSDENFKKAEESEVAYNLFLNNKEHFEKLKALNEKDFDDPILKRQIDVLYRSFLSSQGDEELLKEMARLNSEASKLFNNYRGEIDGKSYTDNEMDDIIKKSTDNVLLEKVWEANKKRGSLVEPILIELVKLRNKHAKNLSFNNYYEFSLFIEEQTSEEILSTFDELTENLDDSWEALKKDMDEKIAKRLEISVEELKPWHYQNFYFQDAPVTEEFDLDEYYTGDVVKNSADFFDGIGLNVKAIIDRSSLYPQEGKCQHAFAEDTDRDGDVRTLINAANNERWSETTLHELGHCVYWSYMDPTIPYFIRETAHTFTTEAVAMMFGRLPKTLPFLKQYTEKELPADEEPLRKKMKDHLRTGLLVVAQWIQVMTRFEKAMYENPDQNLNLLWWDLVKKYQKVNFSRDKPDWASKIHFAIAPVYYHNYLLGEVLASQFHAKNAELTGQKELDMVDYVGKHEIGLFLREKVFNAGNKYHWNTMIEKATGEKLTTKYFIEQFKE